MDSFYQDLLPGSGHYCTVSFTTGRARHAWHETLAELCLAASQASEHTGMYFAPESFAQSGSRKAANVHRLKTLRLDIDAGQKKYDKHHGQGVYRTQPDALTALVEFTKATDLRPSYIVSSGEGWHVYYALIDAVEPPQWTPLAERLALLCQTHGLMVDPAVTTDAARILRIPGSRHEGGNPVRICHASRRLYTPQELDALLPAVPTFTAEELRVNDAVLDGSAPEYPPASALKVAERCPALHHVATLRGDCQEPLWRAMLGLVKHTVEGPELAHEWSGGYEGYSYSETQSKIDAWRVGPATCDEFARHASDCINCPHRGKLKSPIQLGQLTDAEQQTLPPEQQTLQPAPPPAPQGQPWDGKLPPDSRVIDTPEGLQLQYRMAYISEDEDGQECTRHVWTPVSRAVFWFPRWGTSVGGESAQAVMRTCIEGRMATHEMDQTCLATPAKLTEYLASKAVHAAHHRSAPKALVTYAKAAFLMTQNTQRSDLTVTDRFGLRVLDDGELACVHGAHTIRADGTISDTILGRELRGYATSYRLPLPQDEAHDTWPATVWDEYIMPRARRHVAFLKRFFGKPEYASYQVAIMAALASPCMAFATGEWRGGKLPVMSALNISLYSLQGGYGKTSACQAGALAFGDPSMLVRGQGEGAATSNYRMKRLAVSGTMPNVMDEMGSLTGAQAYTMLDMVANGSDRGRARRDGSLMDTSPWSLVNLLTTNRSLQELLRAPGAAKTDAVQRRILEINVGTVPMHSQEERDAFAAAYSEMACECAGALGAAIERELCRAGLAGIHALMRKTVDQAGGYLKAEQNDRFLYRGLGAILAIMTLLKRMDCLPFDPKVVAGEYRRAYNLSLEDITRTREDNHPLQQLNRALDDLLPFTVITSDESSGSHLDRILNAQVPREVKARHVVSRKRTYVSTSALGEWAESHGISLSAVLSAAKEAGVLVPHRTGSTTKRSNNKNLHTGLGSNTGQRVKAYTFNTGLLGDLINGIERPSAEVIELPTRAAPEAPAHEEPQPQTATS